MMQTNLEEKCFTLHLLAMLQTSFRPISTNSLMISTVLMAPESP